MKKLLALLLVLALCFTAVAFADGEEPAQKDIIILYTNDVHCGYKTGLGYTGVAAIKKMLLAEGYSVILVDNGDAVQGDTIGTLSKGGYIIDIMNYVGYDVATIGNHEFDYGMNEFKANVEKANFPYTACNFIGPDGNPVLNSYVMIDNGVKIAFIGIGTPKTFTSSTPAYFQDENGNYIYSFCEDSTGDLLAEAVQTTVDAARAGGADYVVVLCHLGITSDCSPWTSSEIITKTSGINVFLDGHSHSVIPGETVKNKDGEDVILTSTGTKLANLGYMKISVADGSITTGLISAPYGVFTDPDTDAFIAGIEAQFEELQNTVVAHTDVDLVIKDPVTGERIVRSQETNLGDLCADAYRAESGAQIAFINGGGVRDTIPAGDITYGQIIKVHPFGNSMCMVRTKGQTILDALELSASKLPAEYGGFLIPSGLKYTIDLNVESTVVLNEKGEFVEVAGERRVKDVVVLNAETNEYEPIDPEAYYTLACHNYKLKSGGDGYTMFKNDELILDEVMIDNQVLINYIVDVLGGSVGAEYSDPYGEGRIIIIEKAA